MKDLQKHTAALSAAVILLQSIGTGMPAPKLHTLNTVRSAADFSAMLTAASEPEAEPFAELRYDPASGQIFCDGRPVGEHYGGFTVSDGQLTADSGYASGTLLPAEQAAASMGCEIVTETDGSLTVRSPFQTARLVVSSSCDVDPLGGSITAEGYNDLHIIQYDSPQAAYRAYLAYQQDSSIRFVQPDKIRYTDCTAVPADETAGRTAAEDAKSWGYHAIGTEEYLTWLETNQTELPEITVAVLDSGIYAEHNWFKGRISENGIDCSDSSAFSLNDTQGHGTHCAGIICQNTPKTVKILPVKVIADDGYGSDLMIYCGMMYAVEQKADVISMSLGGDGDSPLMLEAMRTIMDADIPCCVAAGNSAFDADYSSPGCYDSAICISAVYLDSLTEAAPDYTDPELYQICRFSNTGLSVDIAAPGQDIISAAIDAPDALVSMSGTSMAAPFAAAACADLLSADPDLKTKQVRTMLQDHAITLPDPQNVDMPAMTCYGAGLLSLRGAFTTDKYIAPPFIIVNNATGAAPNYEAKGSVTLSFVSSLPDAPIYYTLDGSEPDKQNGILYTGIPKLTESAVVRASVICEEGSSKSTAAYICIDGKEVKAPYTISNGVLIEYNGVMKNLDLSKSFSSDYLKTIGDNAFMQRNIESVILPDSVTAIGNQAFYGTPLKQFTGNGVTEIGDYAFADTMLQDLQTEKLNKLGAGAFMNCTMLTDSPAGSDSLTEIQPHTFEGCTSLSTLNLDPEKLTVIGDYAFSSTLIGGEMNLTALKELGEGAFMQTPITSVTLPETITVLKRNVFCDCTALLSLYAPGITELGSLALYGCALSKSSIDYSKLKKLDQVSLAGIDIKDTMVFFDALETVTEQAVGATNGGAMVFPTFTELDKEVFVSTDNLIWLPNAESIVLHAEGMNGLRVSEKLKSAVIQSGSSCAYIIGPKESCIKEAAAKKNIPYFPEQTLITGETAVSAKPGDPFSLYAAFVADPETWLTWYELADGKETAVGIDAVSNEGKPGDLNRSTYSGSRSTAGSYQFRAVLTGPDGIIEHKDFTVNVSEDAETKVQNDLNYTPVTNSASYAKKIYTVGDTILFTPDETIFTIYTDTPCTVRLRAENRNVHVNGLLESRVFGTSEPVSDTEYAELHEGYNWLRLECGINRSVFRMPLTFRIEKVQNALRMTEITPLNAEYTGKAIRPAFRIESEDTLLEEGKDYQLTEETSFTDPGRYQVKLKGIGDYFGEVTAVFTVLPKTEGTLPALTEETKTVSLNAEPVMYSWTPDKAEYGITADSLSESILTVIAPDGTTVASLSGTGYRYTLLTVEPGGAYKVCVSNLYQTETGKITFSLKANCRLLDDAEIEITEVVQYGMQPVYTLKENDKVLEEGTDYTVCIFGTQRHIGRAYLAFRGCGSYIGQTEITYCIAPLTTNTFPDVPPNGQPEPVKLLDSRPVLCDTTSFPGTVQQYNFTAPYDYSYTLMLPEHEQQNISVLLYLNDGDPLLAEEPEMTLELKKDDQLLIMVISDYLLYNVIQDLPRPYRICIKGKPKESELTADGIRYRITEGETATLIGTEDGVCTLTVRDNVKDPETGALYPVTDIDALAFAPFAESCIFYTAKGSLIQEICEQQDYHFIMTDSDFALPGDISGSGSLDYHDVILLQKYLTECDGVTFTAAQAAAADTDQNGSLDLRDLFTLMQQLDPPSETADLSDLPFLENNQLL